MRSALSIVVYILLLLMLSLVGCAGCQEQGGQTNDSESVPTGGAASETGSIHIRDNQPVASETPVPIIQHSAVSETSSPISLQPAAITTIDYAVWSALLRRSGGYVFIVDHTENPGVTASDSWLLSEVLSQSHRTLRDDMWHDLLRRQTKVESLKAERFTCGLVHLLNERELFAMADVSSSAREDLMKRYPGSRGIASLALPGYNAELTQALVYVYGFSSDDGLGQLHFLEIQNGLWSVVTQVMIHTSPRRLTSRRSAPSQIAPPR